MFLVAAVGSCGGKDDDSAGPRVADYRTAPTVLVERPGFRLRHPDTWTIDTTAPGYDPDAYIVLDGPDGATLALMLLDEPADPKSLVDAILTDNGLVGVRERELLQWGGYEGYGRDLSGMNEANLPAGMCAFAWSSDSQSFLVAETYVEYAYAEARQGFDTVEFSFTLLGEDATWPAISLGTRVTDGAQPERWLVRPDFELRFPDDWRIDSGSPDYDPDRFFTLLTPFESSWMVLQLLSGEHDEAALLAEARLGLEPVLEEIDREERFSSWGRLRGHGLELSGGDRDLPATLRVFVYSHGDEALLVTEFWYDELEPKLAPGFARVADSFEFRR